MRNFECSEYVTNGPNTKLPGKKQKERKASKLGSIAIVGGTFSPFLFVVTSRSKANEITFITRTRNEPGGSKK